MSESMAPPLLIVVSCTHDDPYGAQWYYGPYADPAVAARVRREVEARGGRYAVIQRLDFLAPSGAQAAS